MEYLAQRLEFLRSSQNADGGWGYFPAKESWLEPTVYATLALARDPAAADRVRRAWRLVSSWQNPDGGWRPCAIATTSGWSTALAVTLAEVLGNYGAAADRGGQWLLSSSGAESSLLNRVLLRLHLSGMEREVKDAGWPWRPGTSAWVEPTAHSLVALKKLEHRKPQPIISNRVQEGERMLLEVRCVDGGWNYGARRTLSIELPSYAETSALALIGLRQRAPAEAFAHARTAFARKDTSPLGRAWLRIALGLGMESGEGGVPLHDILLCAIEALDGSLLLPGSRV
jgi:hypothetical protein